MVCEYNVSCKDFEKNKNICKSNSAKERIDGCEPYRCKTDEDVRIMTQYDRVVT